MSAREAGAQLPERSPPEPTPPAAEPADDAAAAGDGEGGGKAGKGRERRSKGDGKGERGERRGRNPPRDVDAETFGEAASASSRRDRSTRDGRPSRGPKGSSPTPNTEGDGPTGLPTALDGLDSAALDMPHMPATGVSGFDLYAWDELEVHGYRWAAGWTPPWGQQTGAVGTLASGLSPTLQRFALYLPLYNGQKTLCFRTLYT